VIKTERELDIAKLGEADGGDGSSSGAVEPFIPATAGSRFLAAAARCPARALDQCRPRPTERSRRASPFLSGREWLLTTVI
jgi:hypothetical protein